jgi:hypothetical protein
VAIEVRSSVLPSKSPKTGNGTPGSSSFLKGDSCDKDGSSGGVGGGRRCEISRPSSSGA